MPWRQPAVSAARRGPRRIGPTPEPHDVHAPQPAHPHRPTADRKPRTQRAAGLRDRRSSKAAAPALRRAGRAHVRRHHRVHRVGLDRAVPPLHRHAEPGRTQHRRLGPAADQPAPGLAVRSASAGLRAHRRAAGGRQPRAAGPGGHLRHQPLGSRRVLPRGREPPATQLPAGPLPDARGVAAHPGPGPRAHFLGALGGRPPRAASRRGRSIAQVSTASHASFGSPSPACRRSSMR